MSYIFVEKNCFQYNERYFYISILLIWKIIWDAFIQENILRKWWTIIIDNNNIKSRVEQVAEIGGSCLYASACFVVILIRGVTMVKGCNRHPYFYFDWFIKRFTSSTIFSSCSIQCRNLFKCRGNHFNTNFTVINWMITNRNDLDRSIDLW